MARNPIKDMAADVWASMQAEGRGFFAGKGSLGMTPSESLDFHLMLNQCLNRLVDACMRQLQEEEVERRQAAKASGSEQSIFSKLGVSNESVTRYNPEPSELQPEYTEENLTKRERTFLQQSRLTLADIEKYCK